jgi:hypothetical protein
MKIDIGVKVLYGFGCDLLFKASHLDWSGLRFKFGFVFLWRMFRTFISESVSSFLWHYILNVMNTPWIGNER